MAATEIILICLVVFAVVVPIIGEHQMRRELREQEKRDDTSFGRLPDDFDF